MFNTHIDTHVLRGYEICVTVQEYLLNVLSVQAVYKITIYKRFQFILNHSFIFLVTHKLHTHVMHFI